MGPLIPLFRTSGDVCPGFQSQGGLACMLSCLRAIPQIHLWCDTCRPLDGEHGSRATLTHILAAVRHIHKHWWHQGRSRGSNLWPGPGLKPATLPCRSTAHLTTRPFRFGCRNVLIACVSINRIWKERKSKVKFVRFVQVFSKNLRNTMSMVWKNINLSTNTRVAVNIFRQQIDIALI